MRINDFGSGSFLEKYAAPIRSLISAFFLVVVALFLLSGWFLGETAESLRHVGWSRFFLLVFLFLVWISIALRLKKLAEQGAKKILIGLIPSLKLGVVNILLLLAFIVPAYWIVGRLVYRIITGFDSMAETGIAQEIVLWFSFFPLVEMVNNGLESSLDFLSGDAAVCWSITISVAYSMLVIFVTTMLVSIPAKLLTGSLTEKSILCRIMVGVAMVVYALYLPGWLLPKLNGSFLDLEGVQKLLLTIDGLSGLKLVFAYLLLAVVTAVACSSFVWSVFALFAIGIGLAILTTLFRPLEAIFENEILQLTLFFGMMVFAFGSQVWSMVPTEE